uniref:Uncharacterized protein n=1 Tax=Aegilops tauschii subsp. strangulata TaxID=200361 RepID=A0A453C7X5_AEGTS
PLSLPRAARSPFHFEHVTQKATERDIHGDLELPLAARWLVVTRRRSPSYCLAPSASSLFLQPKTCSISPPRIHLGTIISPLVGFVRFGMSPPVALIPSSVC